ncbi:MAG: NTP transferase domain-containing protein [Planctomycetes bacterium]|nr:NTP transferase domain-containing protein [Planctomycetota bacterium]
MPRPDTVVILAAGQGTRMKSGAPKVLAPLLGRAMLAWVVDQALALEPKRVLVVVGHGADEVQRAAEGYDSGGRLTFVRQEPQRGTGHALQCCLPALGADPGVVVVLYGDMPLLSRGSLERLVDVHAKTAGGAAMLTATPSDPRGFGRIVRRADDSVERIVEQKDAAPHELSIREVNLGVYAFTGRDLVRHLPHLSNDNAQKEYYLTDVIARLVAEGRRVEALVLEDEHEAIGVNTLVHLAEARAVLQRRVLEEHMLRGVYVEDPATTTIEWGVEIGARTHVQPCTVIRSGVKIGEGCEVGPFAHLRSGTVLADGAAVGNFVETKNSTLGPRAKAKHLAYVGDAELGAKVNIGAGTVFANYDGKAKHKCVVEDGAFVGSGTVLVAPVKVGRGAVTGAGAVVKRGSDIPAGEVWIGVPAKKLDKSGDARNPGR